MSSRAWRHELRAEGVERRPPPSAHADRGYVEQPGEQDKPKSALTIPLSVLVDEEEKAIMAELLEEEREAKRKAAEPPPAEHIQTTPFPPLARRRIVTRGDLRPERQPLRASLGDLAQFSQPQNETAMAEPDEIDKQIQALLAKHEEQQREAKPEPAPQEHPTLLSRPEPPPAPTAPLPEDEWEDYHAEPAEPTAAAAGLGRRYQTSVGADGRRFYTPEFREQRVAEYLRRRAEGEILSLEAFGKEHGIHQAVISRWVSAARRTTEVTEMPQANGARERRTFTDHEKLDILDKADALKKQGASTRAQALELDVVQSLLANWRAARAAGKLRRPPGRRPAASAPVSAVAPKAGKAALDALLGEDEEVRDVATVMAELQAAKKRVAELKAELLELL